MLSLIQIWAIILYYHNLCSKKSVQKKSKMLIFIHELLIIIHNFNVFWQFSLELWLMIWAKTDLITTLDHHTTTTKGFLSNSLMINNIRQNRSYHNNWTTHINHKRTNVILINDVLFEPKQILSQQFIITRQQQKNYCLTIFSYTYDYW